MRLKSAVSSVRFTLSAHIVTKNKAGNQKNMVIPRLKYQKINVPNIGSTIDGTVLSKEGKTLFVDVSPLGLAVVRGMEFMAAKNYIKNLNVGDKISVVVTELDNEDGLVEASLKEISNNQV